jgi:hypothetical protein
MLGLLYFAAVLVSVHTNFEGGSLGKVEIVSDTHYRLAVKGESDQDGRNRQANWYYFRVDGAAAQPVTIDIVNLPGEYNYRPNRGAITGDTPPVISYDGVHWEHVTTYEYDAEEPKLRLRIQPAKSRFWIAHCPPYTNEHLRELRADVRNKPGFKQEVIGKTAGGRDLLLWTISEGAAKLRPVVWLMFRQHSWESGSSWVGEGAVRALLGDSAESRRLREQVIWKILPMCDPDGVARGGVRFNVNGYDLNRNWDVADPVRMPEITAQRNAIRKWIEAGNRVDLFLSLHNTETAEYLEGPPENGGGGKYLALAEKLFESLKARTSFAPTRPLSFAGSTTTPGKPGRMTVIQGLWADFQIPGFLMEQRVAHNSKLGGLPGVSHRVKFGAELVKAIAGVF